MVKLPSKKVCIYIINLIIVFVYAFGGLIFSVEGKPFARGFYCNDESITKPYPKQQTVPTLFSVIYIGAASLVCFSIGEFINLAEKRRICDGGIQYLKPWAINVILLLLLIVYGVGITVFVTDIGKYTIGRLRPHFIDVCKPDWNRINCTNSRGVQNYIIGDDFCTTRDTAKLKEARLSFPSGHASGAAVGATFLVMYVEYRIGCLKWGSLAKLFVQVAIGCGGLFIGLSRVPDYMHHPTDVLAGFVIGIVIAVTLYQAVVKNFLPPIVKKPRTISQPDVQQHTPILPT